MSLNQSIRNSRASTVVVTGLQPSPTTSDMSLFTNLYDIELGSKPGIVLTKILGKLQPGRAQPLLVVLDDAKNAQQLIKSAKQLRSSTNADVGPRLHKSESNESRGRSSILDLRTQKAKSPAEHVISHRSPARPSIIVH